MKKILSVLLATLILVSCFAFSSSAYSTGLRFDENGEFKILHICDIQDGYPMKDAEIALLGEMLDYVQPDLVVLGGDNIVCEGTDIYEQFLEIFSSKGIKFTLVFGNHDDECSELTKEEQLEMYQEYDGCLAYDEDPSLHGCGTHSLSIASSRVMPKGRPNNVAFNLWLFDSGDYVIDENGNRDGYDCVREDQINWYKQKSKGFEEYYGKKIPSLAFQHIIVSEAYDALFLKSPVALGGATRTFKNGETYSVIPNLFALDGFIFEGSCPSMYNEGQWDAFVERGDVLGCGFGHDHVNSFVKEYKGVDMIQTAGATYNSYGNDFVRGARVITLNEDDLWSYETELIRASDLAVMKNSEIPEKTGKSVVYYTFINVLYKVFDWVMNIF